MFTPNNIFLNFSYRGDLLLRGSYLANFIPVPWGLLKFADESVGRWYLGFIYIDLPKGYREQQLHGPTLLWSSTTKTAFYPITETIVYISILYF